MAKSPLTNTQIKQAKDVQTLRDGGGLQLRITANGYKRWQLRFTNPYTKKVTEMGLGAYPAVSLAEARKLRESAKELLAQGLNPKEERDTKQRALDESNNNTLEHIASKWFEVKKSKITEGYAKDIWGSLTRHVFPLLGGYPISQLTAPKVIQVLRPLEASGKYDTIKRICQRINELMTYSVNTGVISDNPLSGISKAFSSEKVTNNPHIEPDELPELMNALDIASIKITTRCLIEWQLHTMTRPKEAATAKWQDIDFDNNLWIIPAEIMKTKTEHRIPLTKQMLNLLELLKPLNGERKYLFPSDFKPNQHANTSTANVALKRMGFKGRQTAHGLRGLARTTLGEEGFSHEALEACLSHKVDSL
ncbi:tyrosine-type recombinase/integrase [Psychromonas sp. KJ10-10]|uniref:tyrosine-type recombinase/integrase n=1 Tax=Psychromonas sp. KJ10-10 TaxID=3391823 RepID=UPI0039B5FBB9